MPTTTAIATIKLSASQRAVLKAAARHPQQRAEHFPTGLRGGARTKVLAALHARALLRKRGSGYSITELGLQTIGINTRAGTDTKRAKVIALIQRPHGATMRELRETTQWLPHSVRGFVSSWLRKKRQMAIESVLNEHGERCYRVVAASASAPS